MADMVSCIGCGKELHRTAPTCPHCGAVQPRKRRYKSKVAAGVLALLFGGLGVHRFYLGQWWGVFYLLFFWTLIPDLVAFIEALVFLFTNDQKWDARHNDGMPGTDGSGAVAAVLVGVVAFFVAIAFIGILAAIAIPAFQDFKTRATLMQALDLGRQATAAVDRYFQQHQELPSSLEEAGFQLPADAHLIVAAITLDAQAATLRITPQLRNAPGAELDLSVERGPGGALQWHCSGVKLRTRLLPPECR
jgi:TM2 domain-containing membrane protein YozV/Tfp pilus assembly major pilin PilA